LIVFASPSVHVAVLAAVPKVTLPNTLPPVVHVTVPDVAENTMVEDVVLPNVSVIVETVVRTVPATVSVTEAGILSVPVKFEEPPPEQSRFRTLWLALTVTVIAPDAALRIAESPTPGTPAPPAPPEVEAHTADEDQLPVATP
jgi:hypothetical protein